MHSLKFTKKYKKTIKVFDWVCGPTTTAVKKTDLNVEPPGGKIQYSWEVLWENIGNPESDHLSLLSLRTLEGFKNQRLH